MYLDILKKTTTKKLRNRTKCKLSHNKHSKKKKKKTLHTNTKTYDSPRETGYVFIVLQVSLTRR